MRPFQSGSALRIDSPSGITPDRSMSRTIVKPGAAVSANTWTWRVVVGTTARSWLSR